MRTGLFGWMCAGFVSMSIAACTGENKAQARAASVPAASAASPARAKGDNPCALTVEQVTAITGTPMTLTAGSCTFFPANGRDIPHVFYVLQNPMVCTTIKPSDLGFTETVAALPARAAYVRDQVDGSHVLVCPADNARAFDIVVDIGTTSPGTARRPSLLRSRCSLVADDTAHLLEALTGWDAHIRLTPVLLL